MAERITGDERGAVSLDGRPGRIAVVSLHTSPTATLGHSANGGLNVYVREVCGALARRGVATDVFTRRTDDAAPEIEHLGPESRVVYLPAGPSGLDKYRLLEEVPAFSRAMERFIGESGARYDLLYSHYWLSGLAGCALRHRLHVPWAHTAHTLALVKNRNLAPGDQPEPELRADLEGEIARCADLLVVSTETEAADLRRAYSVRPERIAVIAPGADLTAFRARDRAQAREGIGQSGHRPFVFAGRLERLKGVEVLLRALSLLVAGGSHPEVRLLVLGEDSRVDGESEKGRLKALVAGLGLEGRVHFVGPVPQARLAGYYTAAEACLVPSFSESFGLVALEAQACGTPVIASNVGGLATVVREGVTGFLVDGPDPAAYAGRMRRLLEEPGLGEAMGRRAARRAQAFTWERTADQLLDRFADVPRFTTIDLGLARTGQAQDGVQAASAQE